MLYFLRKHLNNINSRYRELRIYFKHIVMTRRNVRKQGWVFPLFSLDSDDRLSLKITGLLLFYIEVVIHKVWALDNTVYRKCPMALICIQLFKISEKV